jgi:hypothetical protein
MNRKTFYRPFMLLLGVVVCAALACLQVFQYQQQTKIQAGQEQSQTENSNHSDEVRSMPACAQGNAIAQYHAPDLHVIFEFFLSEPDDEPTAGANAVAWTAVLEKILQVAIVPNAP